MAFGSAAASLLNDSFFDESGSAALRELILHHLAPGLGCIVALAMFMSPLNAVLKVKKSKRLGELNPLPLIAIIANCTSWMIYGCIKGDPYVIAANEPGLMLGIFMSLVCYGFAEIKVRDQMITALLFFAVLISSTAIYLSLAVPQPESKIQISGYLAVAVLLIYYAAPLSVLYKVVTSRNGASLHWPLSVMSCVNGSLWVAYGLAVEDAFIWGPNAVGAALGSVQLLLVAIFPTLEADESEAPLMMDQDGYTA